MLSPAYSHLVMVSKTFPLKTLRMIGVLLATTFFSIHSGIADVIKSPLNVVPDSIGEDLQKCFISSAELNSPQEAGKFTAYRKSFTLPSRVAEAKIHLFADARYLLWINGKPIHRGPNRFDFHSPEYDSIDVAEALQVGKNTLAIVVMGYGDKAQVSKNNIGNGCNSRMMKHASGLALQLIIDGKKVLQSDDTWRWSDKTRYRPAKIDWAKVVDRIDARVEDGDWTLSEYDDSAWQPAMRISGDAWGALTTRRIANLRDTPVSATFSNNSTFPVSLSAGQKIQFSMGRMVQAYTMLSLEADAGTELTLDYAGISYLAKAGSQNYISSDSCAFSEGSITVKKGRVSIQSISFVERLYPFDRAGKFHCNEPLLNRLWETCARSLEILSEDAYVDCADRERAEWMDCDPPAYDVTRTAFTAQNSEKKIMYGDARLLGEMLRRTALSQQKEGWVKAHTTSDRFDIHAHMEDRSCDWVQGARRYYESTNDAALIREIWPVIVSQMEYFLSRRTPRGLVLGREWVVWGNPIGYVTCEGAGLNAFIYKALVDAAWLGKNIGESKQADHFEKEAAALATAYNAVLWNETLGTYYSGYYAEEDRAKADDRARRMKLPITDNLISATMFPALWALDQQIVPASRQARVTDYLLKNRSQTKRIMSFYYLFKQLYAQDTDEFDCEILNTIRTKWQPQAESAWSTTWEDFGGGSKAHCYGMYPAYFLSAHVLGVKPELPISSKKIIIEPRLADLTSAEGTVVTEYGLVSVAWKLENGSLHFQLDIPAGITATLRVPHSEKNSKLMLDGKNLPCQSQGRYLETILQAGAHTGYVDEHP